jgi:hypothetical protein
MKSSQPFVPSLLNHSTAISRDSLHSKLTAHLELRNSLTLLSLMLRPTVCRPVSLRIKHPPETYDRIFITVRQLRACWRGALSLTRGRVCCLQLRLVLASTVILRSECHGTRDIFYCLRFETSIFVSSYDSQGYGRSIRPRLHKGLAGSKSLNQSYFTTGCLPPINSSWRKAPWGPRPDFFFFPTDLLR